VALGMVFFGHIQLRHFRLRHTFALFRGYLTLTINALRIRVSISIHDKLSRQTVDVV